MEKSDKRIRLFLLVSTICMVSGTAWAGTGVPMILVAMPAMIIGLIPIIIIEGFILEKRLPISKKKALISSGVSNLVSTLIGVPLTWGFLFIIEYILMEPVNLDHYLFYMLPTPIYKIVITVIFAPWLIPYENDLDWMIPTAMIVLMFPFFFASWKIETYVTTKMNKNLNYKKVNPTCFTANAITYFLLVLYPLGMFLF
ncbi:MAG: hypothetical protein KAJ29_02370 [Alphaproteobacteria bacterium]|nr:hypothetical protein [Alphaproteobacteria bacterium]